MGRAKTRHAAALALVGWYLMVPPTENANHIDPFVPLSKWVVLRAFDTATACDDAQDQLRDRTSHLNLVQRSVPSCAEFLRRRSGWKADDAVIPDDRKLKSAA